MSSRRGIYFKPHIMKMLEAYAEETKLNPSVIVNIALESFFAASKDKLKKAIQLEAEREQLVEEEGMLFRQMKVILRSGIYVEDAEKKLLIGMKPGERPSERITGIISRMPEDTKDVIIRIFERRQEIANRLVEIMKEILPPSKHEIAVTERGREIIRKESPEEFMTKYVVAKTLIVGSDIKN